ncbi:unnamed protein product [Closterium sp. NIES-54]
MARPYTANVPSTIHLGHLCLLPPAPPIPRCIVVVVVVVVVAAAAAAVLSGQWPSKVMQRAQILHLSPLLPTPRPHLLPCLLPRYPPPTCPLGPAPLHLSLPIALPLSPNRCL